MRPPALVLVVLLAALPATASEPSVVLLDWQAGSFAAGSTLAVEGVNSASFPFAVDACHRQLRVDLLYDPAETAVALPGVGEVALLHTFRVEVRAGAALVASRVILQPGYGHALGVPPAGDYEARLVLTQGAAVDWDFRVRGWEVPGEPACLPDVVVSEVEANPRGSDGGREWVELWNRGATDADVSGWTVSGTQGEVVLPDGTLLSPGARLVVAFPQESLGNADAVVVLSALSVVRDATPPLSDASNDSWTWQRGEPWTFAEGTPGA